ncbi:hypothetical protein CIHG_08166 [Coccidioides immitis H538.4]|uniref:Uncharacterized protein n=1 Tax=Coccidioides immitis H538.4 TaxID=396776 RepID=A0A0J8S0K0_COCIT|nr:hypothetical protein CIHG_08166 [Coccidioides immitis H538.4]
MDLRNRPYLRRATKHEWTKDPASRAWDEPTKEAAQIPTLWLGRAANLVASSLGLGRRYDGTLILLSQFRANAKSTPFQVSSRVFGRVDYRDLKSKTPRSKSGLPASQPCWRRIRTGTGSCLEAENSAPMATQRGALGVAAITERRSSSRRW